MRSLFTKPLISYMIGILLFIFITGAIQSKLTNHVIILIAIKGIEFIILTVIILHIYDRYMKPIKKASEAVDKLVQGNYRTRVHDPAQGMMADLSYKINMLARNLSELSIQEDIKAKQLLTVIHNSESGLVLIDEKGYIHLVNRKFLHMFGKTKSDYIGHLYYEVIDNERIHHTVQETFLYEKNVKDYFTRKSSMNERHIEVVGAPIFNERNMLNGAVLVLYDITELKKLEIMRKDFVANVSHELKTPITSISGFAETLLEGNLDEEQTKQFLHIIFEESKRVEVIVSDLLTLSKLERENPYVSFTHIDVSLILHDISPIIEHQAKQKGIAFTIDLQSEDLSLQADEEMLKQILLNLLTNAVNYTPSEGEVNLEIGAEKEYIRFKITDTGIGIDKEDIPRLFERFYRVDQARSRNTGGTGLGLAIVKHIVEVHNGKVTVDSELNKGSTFTVYLPKEHEKEEP
ncbi:MAG TPA: ATP-binding protein [Bacillota bacterium]